MMMFGFFLIVGLFCWYILSPFFMREYKDKKWDSGSVAKENLQLRKQEILSAINDLEYDMKLKKMNPTDYKKIKEQLVSEGAAVLEALHKLEAVSVPKTHHKPRKKAVA